MRPHFAVLLLMFSLLGACGGHDHCLVTTNPNEAGCSVATAPPGKVLAYTSNPAQPAQTEIIPVVIDGEFKPSDRERILRALDEWNYVLNGQARLDVSPLPFGAASSPLGGGGAVAGGWVIAKVSGGNSMPTRGMLFGHALAQTHRVGNKGGLIMVFVDRIGSRDLAGVMKHEIGHMLGLEHDSAGHLMAPQYSASNVQCIDQAAAQGVSAARGVPVSELNWCGEFAPTLLAAPQQRGMSVPVMVATNATPVPPIPGTADTAARVATATPAAIPTATPAAISAPVAVPTMVMALPATRPVQAVVPTPVLAPVSAPVPTAAVTPEPEVGLTAQPTAASAPALAPGATPVPATSGPTISGVIDPTQAQPDVSALPQPEPDQAANSIAEPVPGPDRSPELGANPAPQPEPDLASMPAYDRQIAAAYDEGQTGG